MFPDISGTLGCLVHLPVPAKEKICCIREKKMSSEIFNEDFGKLIFLDKSLSFCKQLFPFFYIRFLAFGQTKQK